MFSSVLSFNKKYEPIHFLITSSKKDCGKAKGQVDCCSMQPHYKSQTILIMFCVRNWFLHCYLMLCLSFHFSVYFYQKGNDWKPHEPNDISQLLKVIFHFLGGYKHILDNFTSISSPFATNSGQFVLTVISFITDFNLHFPSAGISSRHYTLT